MSRVRKIIFSTAIMQIREEVNEIRFNSGSLCDAMTIFAYPLPMGHAVNSLEVHLKPIFRRANDFREIN
jgi:hypothetical protein